MNRYVVYLYRSGRVWVAPQVPHFFRGEQPILTRTVQAENQIAALGLALLAEFDRANQLHQHVCEPCTRPHIDDPFNIESRLEPCPRVHLTDVPDGPVLDHCISPVVCDTEAPSCPYCMYWAEPCICGLSRVSHTQTMSPAHTFRSVQ